MAVSQYDTPHALRVGLTTFASYLTARSSQRIDCVREQIRTYDKDYHPGPSFYGDFKGAVVRGRLTGADELVLRRVIAAQSDGPRQRHYRDLADHWLALKDLRLPVAPYGVTTWQTPRLAVSIRPDLAVTQEDGRVLIIKLWFKEPELPSDAARGCLRLLDRHMPELSPGGQAVVVDVRREKIHRVGQRPFKRGFDEYLEAEALAMAALWERLAA